jgi:transposase
MRDTASFPRILIYIGQVDFRKRRRSLAAFLQDQIGKNSFSSTSFLFLNCRMDCIRAVNWNKTGFAMWEKELEKDKLP